MNVIFLIALVISLFKCSFSCDGTTNDFSSLLSSADVAACSSFLTSNVCSAGCTTAITTLNTTLNACQCNRLDANQQKYEACQAAVTGLTHSLSQLKLTRDFTCDATPINQAEYCGISTENVFTMCGPTLDQEAFMCSPNCLAALSSNQFCRCPTGDRTCDLEKAMVPSVMSYFVTKCQSPCTQLIVELGSICKIDLTNPQSILLADICEPNCRHRVNLLSLCTCASGDLNCIVMQKMWTFKLIADFNCGKTCYDFDEDFRIHCGLDYFFPNATSNMAQMCTPECENVLSLASQCSCPPGDRTCPIMRAIARRLPLGLKEECKLLVNPDCPLSITSLTRTLMVCSDPAKYCTECRTLIASANSQLGKCPSDLLLNPVNELWNTIQIMTKAIDYTQICNATMATLARSDANAIAPNTFLMYSSLFLNIFIFLTSFSLH
eukprot:Nk52_evm1s386 gene=Nk52_evmTU1s386